MSDNDLEDMSLTTGKILVQDDYGAFSVWDAIFEDGVYKLMDANGKKQLVGDTGSQADWFALNVDQVRLWKGYLQTVIETGEDPLTLVAIQSWTKRDVLNTPQAIAEEKKRVAALDLERIERTGKV